MFVQRHAAHELPARLLRRAALRSSPDYQALRIATAVLSGRLFTEIRSRRNLTYAVDAPFIERAIAVGRALRHHGVSRLRARHHAPGDRAHAERRCSTARTSNVIVQQFITEYFLNNETNAEQANFLARAELYRGDCRLAEQFVDELRAVTPEDIRNAVTQIHARDALRLRRRLHQGDARADHVLLTSALGRAAQRGASGMPATLPSIGRST